MRENAELTRSFYNTNKILKNLFFTSLQNFEYDNYHYVKNNRITDIF